MKSIVRSCLRPSRLLQALPFLACLLGGACSSGPPTLRIDSVSPAQLAEGRGAQLLVSGSGFRQSDTIRLNGVPVGGSAYVNEQWLSATLPPDLPAGSYSVVVAAPDGREAEKKAALRIGSPAVARTSVPTASPRTATSAPTERPKPPMPTRAPATESPPSPTPPPTPAPVTRAPVPAPSPVTPATALNVSGHWRLVDTITSSSEAVSYTFPDVLLQQQGNAVTGSGSGLTAIQGILNGLTLNAAFTAFDGTNGTFVWTFSPDGTSFSGSFSSSNPNSGVSSGSLVSRGAEAAPSRAVDLTGASLGQPAGRLKPKQTQKQR